MAKKKGKGKGKGALSRNRARRSFKSKDLEKRIQRSSERSKGGKNVFKSDLDIPVWRSGDGEHIIDIIPYFAGSKDPNEEKGGPTYTFEYMVHTRVGPSNLMIICPLEMYGKPCPICEHRQSLIEKDKKGKNKNEWVKLFPRKRNLYNVVSYDKKEKGKGVQVWDVSWHYFEKFLSKIAKERNRKTGHETTIPFPHPEKGRSIRFEVEPAKSVDDYPEYLGHKLEKRGYKIDDEILDSVFTLDEIVSLPSYDEISDAYWAATKDVKTSKGSDEDEIDREEISDLIDELEDIDDFEDLKEFIDENDIEVKIKRKDDFDDAKEKVEDYLNDLKDEEDEPEEEDEEEGENEYTFDEIMDMKKKALKNLIKEEDLDVDPDDADDIDELREMVAEELGIDSE